SLEAVAALRPDLVVATIEGAREDTFTQLTRLGIPVYLVAVHRVAEVKALIVRLGGLTGRQAAAGAIVTRLEQRIDAVTKAVGSRDRPRVLYVLWPEPLIVPGRDTIVTELLQLAWGRSPDAGHL